MHKTVTISLPDDLREFVAARTRTGNFASTSEFIRQLIREDRERIEQQSLERILLEGLDSGTPIPVTNSYWANVHKHVKNRTRARKQAG